MINLDGMISIPFLKKTVFTGSYRGMHYLLRKQELEDGNRIQAAVWPGPYIFSLTEEEKKTYQEFDFSREGIEEAVRWLNLQYTEHFSSGS